MSRPALAEVEPPAVTPLRLQQGIRVRHFAPGGSGAQLASSIEAFLKTNGREFVALSYSFSAPIGHHALLTYTEPEEHDA